MPWSAGCVLTTCDGLTTTEREYIMNKQLLRVNEAAAVLNVSRWTVYRWVEEGKLSATKIGKQSLRVIANSIDKLISEHRTDS